jgi:outer membrane protein
MARRGTTGRLGGAPPGAWALALLALCLAASAASAQALRVGYIDSVRIFENYSLAKDAQERFSREIEAWRRESDQRLEAIQRRRTELKEESLLLSEEKRLEAESQMQKSLSEYEQFVQAFWGPNGRAASLNEQLTAEVIGKVREVVERIARDETYDLVLDAADGNVIFAVKSLDLTDRVLGILNQEAAGTTLPSGTR